MKNLFHPFQVIGMEFLRIVFSYICCLFGIVSVTEETVQHWIENEKSVITGKDVHWQGCALPSGRLENTILLDAPIILSHTVLQLYYLVLLAGAFIVGSFCIETT